MIIYGKIKDMEVVAACFKLLIQQLPEMTKKKIIRQAGAWQKHRPVSSACRKKWQGFITQCRQQDTV
jgi:L-asparaginase II